MNKGEESVAPVSMRKQVLNSDDTCVCGIVYTSVTSTCALDVVDAKIREVLLFSARRGSLILLHFFHHSLLIVHLILNSFIAILLHRLLLGVVNLMGSNRGGLLVSSTFLDIQSTCSIAFAVSTVEIVVLFIDNVNRGLSESAGILIEPSIKHVPFLIDRVSNMSLFQE